MLLITTPFQHLVEKIAQLLWNGCKDDLECPLASTFVHHVMRVQQLECNADCEKRSGPEILLRKSRYKHVPNIWTELSLLSQLLGLVADDLPNVGHNLGVLAGQSSDIA